MCLTPILAAVLCVAEILLSACEVFNGAHSDRAKSEHSRLVIYRRANIRTGCESRVIINYRDVSAQGALL